MRKMMALVLSAAMALSLTACGGQSGEKPADTKAAGSSTAASEAAGSGDSASVDTAGVAAPGSPERYSVGGGSAGGNFYIVGGGVDSRGDWRRNGKSYHASEWRCRVWRNHDLLY